MGLGPKTDHGSDEIMSEINMTPLIDIMLVLLIIFMVTSSISFESGMDINLPESKNPNGAIQEGSAVIVSMDAQGNLVIQGEKVLAEEFVLALKKVLDQEKTTTVILEGDSAAQLGKVVEVMDLAKEAGATHFSMATSNPAAN
jgi:biopolymer transport protein ExbD